MKKISYDRDLSFLSDIVISPNIKLVILYTHFMKKYQSSWNFKSHSHSFHELHIVLNGECDMNLEDKSIHLSTNTFMLISPDTKHTFIQCNDDFLRFSIAFDIVDNKNQILSAKHPSVMHLTQKCICYIKNILAEYNSVSPGCKNIINSLTTCLLIELLRFSDILCLNVTESHMHPALGNALQFIENNLSQKITVSDTAETVFLSVRQLNRIFLENIGMTVSQYIRLKKINNIKEYLKKTDLTLNEIAFLSGIDDESALCKIFKRETGFTPKTYRLSKQ